MSTYGHHCARAILSLDRGLSRVLTYRAGRWPLLDGPLLACARHGSAAEVALMLLVGLRHGPAGRLAVWRCLAAVALLYVLVEVIGSRAGRARPFASAGEAVALVPHHPGRSFPSRHVASALAMAGIVRPVAPRCALLMTAVAWGLGLGRVRAGLHYPSDVAAGGAGGWLVGRLLR